MRGAGKEKKAKVAERGEEGGSPTASPELVESISKLQDVQDELEKINRKASDEVLKLEQKFNELRKPIFTRRNEVIGSIREFWLTAFLSHPSLGDLLNEEDQKILKHMVSLEVEEAKDVKMSFSIIFNFSPSPYFEDEKLTKTYCFDEAENLSIVCQPIKWKEGKGISKGNDHDKGAKRPYTSSSFFTWFSEAVRSDGRVDEIAEIIRDDLWSNPLRHFQNEVDAMGLYGEGDSEEATGGGNEADDEDEYEDEEELEMEDVDDKEYHEEDGDDEAEEDDDEDGGDDGDADVTNPDADADEEE